MKQPLLQLCKLTGGAGAIFAGLCAYKGDERFYTGYVMPGLHCVLDGERAHRLAVWAAKKGYGPKSNWEAVVAEEKAQGGPVGKISDFKLLDTKMFGLHFSNPIGLAAGFDKSAEAINGLQEMGFGFVEIGSVTPKPQEGNPKPRVFRLSKDQAVINRYGFNNDGHDVVSARLKKFRRETGFADDRDASDRVVVGVNLGKNKMTEDPVVDYVRGVEVFGHLADYLVINVSSPNTPTLRSLQKRERLKTLIQEVLQARKRLVRWSTSEGIHEVPVLLKVAPDLSQDEKEDIANVILEEKCRVDGLIVSNTTISRPETLLSRNDLTEQAGGLSGAPLKNLSTEAIRDFYRLTRGAIPIIGVGGISSGRDAYEKIRAGASLVQIYTCLVYHGPPVVGKINRELADELRKNGFKNIKEAVGVDHKEKQ